MKITPKEIAERIGLTESSVRRRVIAVAKEKKKRRFKYSKNMNLNGLAIATLESIALHSKDKSVCSAASELLQSIQCNEPIEKRASNAVIPVQYQRNESSETECIENANKKDALQQLSDAIKPHLKNWKFDLINLLDIGLIFWGLWLLYGFPGLLLAIMVCLFLLEAQATAKKPDLRQSNYSTLNVVGWMCVASFFLHFITFWNATPMEFNMDTLEGVFKVLIAGIPAAFISVLSYKSVETTNKKAKEAKQ